MTDVPLPPKDTALLPVREAPYNPNDWPLNAPSQTVDPQIDWQPVDIALLPGVPGQRGPTGPAGPQGAKGDSGGFFTFAPQDSLQVWNITHNLGYNPGVRVVNQFGTEFMGDIVYNNSNSLTITFSQAVYATAYLS
jgi:hypothetical protein